MARGEAIEQPAKGGSCRAPATAKTALFGDGQYSGGADKFMRAPYPNPGDANFSGRYSGTQGFRHLKPQQRRQLRRPRGIMVRLFYEQRRWRGQRRARHRVSFQRQFVYD